MTPEDQTRPRSGSLNVDFLRSGLQFSEATAAPAGVITTPMPMPKSSTSRRLEQFYAQSLKAAAEAALAAASREENNKSCPPSLVNVAFLQSGLEFREDASTMCTPTTLSPRSTRNRRLENFHNRTMRAAAEASSTQRAPSSPLDVPASSRMRSSSLNDSTGSPPTMVNLSFLRSGLEFREEINRMHAPNSLNDKPEFSPKIPRSRRLENFHNRTMQAAEQAAKAACH